MSTDIEFTREMMNYTLKILDALDKEIREKGLTNEQWFIDCQDKLNEISVR